MFSIKQFHFPRNSFYQFNGMIPWIDINWALHGWNVPSKRDETRQNCSFTWLPFQQSTMTAINSIKKYPSKLEKSKKPIAHEFSPANLCERNSRRNLNSQEARATIQREKISHLSFSIHKTGVSSGLLETHTFLLLYWLASTQKSGAR